ncbi:hypothetical protein, partial [Verrucomicrobium sp. BvORR034]|uniref:hypothetical protein n=1 Tax=Verrucomicrobium sp. BvORR034 TaxID=1396418 RepID=UPI000678F454
EGKSLPKIDSVEFEMALIVLASEVGVLLGWLAHPRDNISRETILEILRNILHALLSSSNAYGINLNDAVWSNLVKICDHRPPVQHRRETPLFDDGFSYLEQFPDCIRMDIFDVLRGTKQISFQQCNSINIGKQLSDNKRERDGYRFHDVFHLAYAAILGWSPTLRALLRIKRKSNGDIDDAEDGQRAGFLEEGLIALIFQYAQGVNFFDGMTKVDYSLLKLIPDFVRGYEVERCALWEWENAILKGFEVFRQLRSYERGTIVANIKERTISFEELPANHLPEPRTIASSITS